MVVNGDREINQCRGNGRHHQRRTSRPLLPDPKFVLG